MRFRLIFSIVFVCLLVGCGGPGRRSVSDSNKVRVSNSKEIVQYSGYVVSYNQQRKIPNWVLYELSETEIDGDFTREGKKFCPDPKLKLAQASDYDYSNSGWSRGHMAPAGDFKWSERAMTETFYFTNCCPQNQSLNAGQWSTLEKRVRGWAKKFGSVTVVTGPLVFENAYGVIGDNSVVVPDAFFKAILSGNQSIAFVMYNKDKNANMHSCAISVDSLEVLSGLDFFPDLEDAVEDSVEASYSLKYWGL